MTDYSEVRAWFGVPLVKQAEACQQMKTIIAEGDPLADVAAQLLSFARVKLAKASDPDTPVFAACNTQLTLKMWNDAMALFTEEDFPTIFWARLNAKTDVMVKSNKNKLQEKVDQVVQFADALKDFGLVIYQEAGD